MIRIVVVLIIVVVAMLLFNRKLSGGNGGKDASEPEWPIGEDGEPVAPAYLEHISGGPLDLEMKLSLLNAYGIPHTSRLPNNGSFGKMIFGHPPSGMEIYVPETMLEDAQNILTAEIVEAEIVDE